MLAAASKPVQTSVCAMLAKASTEQSNAEQAYLIDLHPASPWSESAFFQSIAQARRPVQHKVLQMSILPAC